MTTADRRSSLSMRRLVVAAVALLALFVTVGCATARPSPAEAKRSAAELLRQSEAHVAADWAEVPEPSAERCGRGVRFGYFVSMGAPPDSRALARDLQAFWRSEGLAISPSETDFGAEAGVLHSATADRDDGAGAACQISDAVVVIHVTSTCADGSIDDYAQ